MFEHAWLYNLEGELTPDWRNADIRSARVRRAGTQVSLITYGSSLWQTLDAARELAVADIDAEVLDLRVQRSLDTTAILASVRKTRRAVVIDEGWKTGSLADLVRRVRAFSLKSAELSDPTVTVTNLGEGGADLMHGVIHPPQVAIIGFGRAHERAWVVNGTPQAIPVVTATLAADHRVTDGHLGALFLAELSRLLQTPATL